MENKDNIRKKLIEAGRELVYAKGADFLTARKLSEASGCSIGTIYNQFANMDEFAIEQNKITIEELNTRFAMTKYGNDGYCNLMQMVETFVAFVLDNRQLWFLLYNFHLNKNGDALPWDYKRKIVRLMRFADKDFERMFKFLGEKRRLIMRRVFELGLFGFSAMLSTEMLGGMKSANRDNLCQIFANTFLAGIMLLEKE